MKNLLIFFISISFVFNAFSQDNIILKDGTEISAKVSKIDQNNIEYKKFTNLDGPTYSIPIQNVFMIQYKNGTRYIFNTQSTNTQQQPTNSTNQNIPNLKIETVNIPAGTF